jgi:pilus assembly protein Flp/PilA
MTLTGRRMLDLARRLLRDEEGAALIEYGLLVMLVALLCILAVKTIGSKVANGYNSANSLLP